MSAHNVCFKGKIRKISILLDGKKCLNLSYAVSVIPGPRRMYYCIYPKYWDTLTPNTILVL